MNRAEPFSLIPLLFQDSCNSNNQVCGIGKPQCHCVPPVSNELLSCMKSTCSSGTLQYSLSVADGYCSLFGGFQTTGDTSESAVPASSEQATSPAAAIASSVITAQDPTTLMTLLSSITATSDSTATSSNSAAAKNDNSNSGGGDPNPATSSKEATLSASSPTSSLPASTTGVTPGLTGSASSGGLSTADNIALGTGIGVGAPGTLAGICAAYFGWKTWKQRQSKRRLAGNRTSIDTSSP